MEPVNVALVLTDSKCSINCVFCNGSPMGDIKGNVDFELKKLKEIVKEREVMSIEISGNDPCEYEGLFDFIKKAKEISKTDAITVSTYGGLIKNESYLKELVKSGMTGVRIPIYGATPKVHDAIIDSEGGFYDLIKCLKNIENSKPKLNVVITSLVMKENQEHLKELFYVFSKLGFVSKFRLGLPAYVEHQVRFKKSVPDFSKLKEDLPDALKYALKKGLKVDVADIPYCLVGFDYPYMVDSPRGYKAYEYRRAETELMKVVDEEVVPYYLQKTKGEECASCVYNRKCEGIFARYVKNGFFEFVPIKSDY